MDQRLYSVKQFQRAGTVGKAVVDPGNLYHLASRGSKRMLPASGIAKIDRRQ